MTAGVMAAADASNPLLFNRFGEGDGETGECENGFFVAPELETIDCAEDNIAPFSLPSEALSFEPTPQLIISQFENGDKERNIHCNTELHTVEQTELGVLQKTTRDAGLSFYPSVTAMATRFLSHARMDVKKAMKNMQATQDWRHSYFKDGPLRDEVLLEDLQHGIAYFVGRDHQLRPTLVVRGNRIPAQWFREKRVDKLIRVLVFCLEYMLRYMVVPGRIENLVVVVDLKGCGVGQMCLTSLREIYTVMSQHYPGRVFKFLIVNMPTALGWVAGAAKNLLSDRQKQKLQIVRDVKDLRQYFALHQLERDLGGSRRPVAQFFPFPLQAGPFDPGNDSGPNSSAVHNVHRVLTTQSAKGHLWDPELTPAHNKCVEYSSEASDIFAQCGLDVHQADSSWTPHATCSRSPECSRSPVSPQKIESEDSIPKQSMSHAFLPKQSLSGSTITNVSKGDGVHCKTDASTEDSTGSMLDASIEYDFQDECWEVDEGDLPVQRSVGCCMSGSSGYGICVQSWQMLRF